MRRVKHPGIAALTAVLAVSLLALVPATAGAGAKKPPKPLKKTVTVEDYFYGPAKLTLTPGSTVTWEWPPVGGDSHDVKLGTGPKGAKKFQSGIATAAYTFKQTFKVPGKYHIICTLHDEMTMDITVR